MLELRKATRKNVKIKMALQGIAGSGKTYSSLLIAKGIVNDWNKIVIIDTESNSADLYAHLCEYNVLNIKAPFTPEKYVQAIDVCLKAGMEVIIIDSISHCWDCLIETHASMTGNSFTNWGKITPRQNSFINKILEADVHIIATMRVKQDYVLNQKDGKYVPEKVGLKAVQRDGVDYEFTIVMEIDIRHHAKVSKDRTNLFLDKSGFVITEEVGRGILQWCTTRRMSDDEIQSPIEETNSIDELKELYNAYPEIQESHASAFSDQKNLLIQGSQINKPLISKFNQNGNFIINR